MYNPFIEKINDDSKDDELITGALKGEKNAFESLILRHQSWIYNISLSMIGDIHSAEDITQEILIKVITKLSTYNKDKASFRTWLYRIVVNHIINLKESKKEKVMGDLMRHHDFNDYVSRIPDTRKSARPGHDIIIEETKVSCIQCILLCLDKRERIVFVLGTVFNVNDKIGSEICEITKDNFRKILSRTRKKVFNFFQKNCSLMSEDNPCKCDEKTNPLIKLDAIDTDNPRVEQESFGKISDVLSKSIKDLEDSYYEYTALIQSQPFLKGPDSTEWLKDVLERNDFNGMFN